MWPLRSSSQKRKPKPRGAKRRKPASRRRAKPQGFAKWWSGQKRRARYVRQGLAPYAVVLSFTGVMILLAGLWASGVFGQLREEFNTVAHSALTSNGFTIQNITVEGRKYTETSELIEALNAGRGSSLMRFDMNSARRRIEQLAWVDQANIVRLWPDKLHIVLVEHRPVAIWQLNGKLALVNRAGQVIVSDRIPEFSHLPHVVGLGAAEKASDLIETLNQYPLIQTRVKAAIRVGQRRWNLRLESGVDVQLPDQDEEAALGRLLALEEQHRLLARDITVIDLRDPERLYVRLSSDKVLQFEGLGLET